MNDSTASLIPAAAAPATAPLPSARAPEYTLDKGKTGSEMRVGGWTIRSAKKAILNGKEIDVAEKELCLPLPEMTFGNNSLSLSFEGGVEITFDTMSALRGVAIGEGWEERVGGGVLVSMAESWSKRSASTALSDVSMSTKPVRPHDWTFSTTYAGTVVGGEFTPSDTAEIPMKLLARQDPVLDRILFYEDVGLFEDELHDHGESILNVRLRVMPHSLFLLSRLFVRVDNVLFRIYDVRMYHAFDSGEVVRECSGLEATYEQVKSYLEKPTELTPLTDPNWVYGVLQRIAKSSTPSQTSPPGPAQSSSQPKAAATQAPWDWATAGQTTQAPWASSTPRSTQATTQAPWDWATGGTNPTTLRETTPAASGAQPPITHSSSSSASSAKKGKPWPGLGKHVHVLRLPGGVGSAQAGLRDLALG